MKILGITFLVVLNCFSFFSQKDLNEKEAELNVKLLALRSAKTDEEIDDLNANFKKAMEAFLKNI
jgi:hypothetical protein